MPTAPYILRHLVPSTVFAACILVAGCGDNGPSPTDTASPKQEKAPAPNVILPESGQITTSAPGIPSQAQTAPQMTRDGKQYIQLTPEQQQQLVDTLMVNEAKAQAAGLGNGRVTVNKAWNYTGWTVLEMNPNSTIEARFVAVDVTIEGHTIKFDSDDIEIIDAVTGASYGSDPHSVFLTKDGKIIPNGEEIPVAPNPTRMLLIYAFPKETKKFSLSYWHKNLLGGDSVEIADDGWALPYPAQEPTE